MNKRDRLIPLRRGKELMGIISFYINNDCQEYIERDPWEVLEDNPNGDTIYIAQLVTDKKNLNTKDALLIYCDIKKYIKRNFANVKKIRWNRWKNNRLNIYKGEI